MEVECLLSLAPANDEPQLQSPEFQRELQEFVSSLKAHGVPVAPRILFRDGVGTAAYLTGAITIVRILVLTIGDIVVA